MSRYSAVNSVMLTRLAGMMCQKTGYSEEVERSAIAKGIQAVPCFLTSPLPGRNSSYTRAPINPVKRALDAEVRSTF